MGRPGETLPQAVSPALEVLRDGVHASQHLVLRHSQYHPLDCQSSAAAAAAMVRHGGHGRAIHGHQTTGTKRAAKQGAIIMITYKWVMTIMMQSARSSAQAGSTGSHGPRLALQNTGCRAQLRRHSCLWAQMCCLCSKLTCRVVLDNEHARHLIEGDAFQAQMCCLCSKLTCRVVLDNEHARHLVEGDAFQAQTLCLCCMLTCRVISDKEPARHLIEGDAVCEAVPACQLPCPGKALPPTPARACSHHHLKQRSGPGFCAWMPRCM